MQRTIAEQIFGACGDRSSSIAPGPRSWRIDDADSQVSEPSAAFRSFASTVREELDPVGPLETVLANRAIAAAWRIEAGSGQEGGAFTRESASAELSLVRMVHLLDRIRHLRAQPGPKSPDRSVAWRDRLDHDATLSATSPLIRGTWITVEQILTLILEGSSWKDILRTYPELTEDDLRACLSYAVERDPQ